MTITLLTLIVLTLGNGYYLVKTHKRINNIEGRLTSCLYNMYNKVDNSEFVNHKVQMYEFRNEWNDFNKSINNTKLLKLSGFKKYNKKQNK